MSEARPSQRDAIGIATLMLLAIGVGGFGLSTKPLWNDEAFSFFVAEPGIGHALTFMQADTQPPVYYLLLTAWLRLGHEPAVLRGLSVAAIVLSVPFLYDLVRRLLDRPAAILAVLVFILDGNVVLWEQRARPYALQAAFVAVALWGFGRIWLEGRRAPLSAWAAWSAGGALALLTQYPAGFFLLGANIAVAIRLLPHARQEMMLLWRWSLAQLVLLALCVPWMPAFLAQFAGHLTPEQMESHHRIFLIDRATLFAGLRGLGSVPTLWRAQLPFLVLFTAIAGVGVAGLARRKVALPILGVSLVPLGICLAGYALVHPVFGYVIHNFVWILLPYAVLLAAGLRTLPLRAAVPVGALLLAGNLWGLANLQAEAGVALDRAGRAIGISVRDTDGLVLDGDASARWALGYYLGPPYRDRLAGLNVTMTDAEAPGWAIDTPGKLAGLARLWLVLPDGEAPAVGAEALAAFDVGSELRLPGVTVRRYDRRP